jgi:O-antigen/teichoic acid export membrane protein
MKRHLTNAAYGVLDYVSYPLGMLLVAPIVLHKLGAAEYGLWAIATAVVSTGGIIASGFCDANIQRVARLRGTGETASMAHAVRSMLGINLALGFALALIVWLASPFAARHIAIARSVQFEECLFSLRIASVLILVRAIESVSVSTQRAFEQYRYSVQINTWVRLLTLGSAAVLALSGQRTVSILVATALFLAFGTFLQLREACRVLGCTSLWPVFQPQETRILLGIGVFSWIQSLGSVIFGQFDRVLLGVSLGAAAVAPYSLCVQFAQPLHGLTASGLQFLFPYLSSKVGTISTAALRRTLVNVFLCNLTLVALGAGMLLLFGQRLIQAWAGAAVAHSAARILPFIVLGSSLMGLSVTGTYAMLALGLFRTVALLSLSARGAMLLLMAYLLHRFGLQGLAVSRVFYGFFSLLLYVPLMRRLEIGIRTHAPAYPAPATCELSEVLEP